MACADAQALEQDLWATVQHVDRLTAANAALAERNARLVAVLTDVVHHENPIGPKLEVIVERARALISEQSEQEGGTG